MEAAIKKLVDSGMTEKDANEQFNGVINWYMRGTLHTAGDRRYAAECAIEDIMGGGRGGFKMINKLTAMIAEQTKQAHYDNARQSILKEDKDLKRWNSWVENIYSGITAKAIPGKKYTKIDVCLPQQSGRYMVEIETGKIYGIKAYGVINRLHQYGTLDTIDDYYWGDYTARHIRAEVAKC